MHAPQIYRLRFMLTILVTLTVANIATWAEEPTRFAADRPLDCLHIKLDLDVDVVGKRVDGVAHIGLRALRTCETITFDAVDLEVRSVKLIQEARAVPVDYTNDGEHLELQLTESLTTGEEALVVVDYAVDDPDRGLHYYGPSEDEPDVAHVVWSQGQTSYNRYWFPCFDHPNEMQTSETIITADAAFAVSSNGKLLSQERHGDKVTYHYLQDRPHAAYLVSMIVGEFYIERDTWRGKPIEYWAHPKFKDYVAGSFANTKSMLDFFTEKIGVEYPWDRYAQICCEGFGGGMENTSATTLGNRALHDERSLLDASPDGLIAHELAHQWWGDMITCKDWAHTWLNEGFASYFEALWDEEDLGPDEFSYNMFSKAERARRGGKDEPVVDRAYRGAWAMFDSRAYPKGAWVLHMVRKRLGDDLFWHVMNQYATRYKHKTVETSDFRKTIEDVTGRSFERFFYDWTGRPGHPELSVATQWLNDDKLVKIDLKQKQKDPAFHFPLTLEFAFGDEYETIRVTRDMTDKEMTFYYPLPASPNLVTVDPEYTVLMELTERKGDDLWKTQLLEDPSPIARIHAAKHYGESKSTKDRRLLAEALMTEKYWGVQREIAEALGESGGDIARDALIEGLADTVHHKVRRACAEQLAKFHEDETVIAALRPIAAYGDPSYRVEAAAIESYAKLDADDAVDVLARALARDSYREIIRSAALDGFGHLDDERVVDILCQWTKPTKPRLARPSALSALAEYTKNRHITDGVYEQIVDHLTLALEDTGDRVRRAAASALGDLADPAHARTALASLESIEVNDTNRRVRGAARRAIDAIRKGEPAQVQLADLRDEIKTVVEENKKILDRLEKIEAQPSDDNAEEAEEKIISSAGKVPN